jgi:ADP-heptose:LPS heptosyltransferase
VKEKIDSDLSAIDFKDILVWSSMGIGNVINFAPMLKTLRHRYPKARITLLSWSNPNIYDLLDDSYYDELFLLKKKSNFNLWFSCFLLFIKSYDLFIVKWHNTAWMEKFIIACRRSVVIGHMSSAGWISKVDHLLDVGVPLKSGASDKNQYIGLLSSLGIEEVFYDEHINISAKIHLKVGSMMHDLQLDNDRKLIGFHVDTGQVQQYKQIGFDKWVQVIEQVKLRFPHSQLLLIGLSGETVSAKVLDYFRGDSAVINCLSKFNILETAALISRLDLLIGNDSSLKTIASAVGTVAVVPYGCTDFSRSAPKDSLIKVVRVDLACSPCDILGATNWSNCSHRRCMNDLNPELIVQAIFNSLLEG